MVLNYMIQRINSDHRNKRVHDQEMSPAVIELFHWLYGMWHRLVETTYWPHQYHPISAKELCYRVAILSTINSCYLTSLILKKVQSDDASCPKFTLNSDVGAFIFHILVSFPNPKHGNFGDKAIEVKMCFIAQDYFARKTSIHFLIINNPFHVVVSYNASFLLNLNSQAVKLFFFQDCQLNANWQIHISC